MSFSILDFVLLEAANDLDREAEVIANSKAWLNYILAFGGHKIFEDIPESEIPQSIRKATPEQKEKILEASKSAIDDIIKALIYNRFNAITDDKDQGLALRWFVRLLINEKYYWKYILEIANRMIEDNIFGVLIFRLAL
jgi:hypothetical protein